MTVILATHVGDTLSVFRRDGQNQLRQVAHFVTDHPVAAPDLMTLLSDLDLELGWSRNGVALDDGGGGATLDRRELPAGDGPDGGTRPVTPRGEGRNVRAEILEALTESPEPMTIKQLGGEWVRYHIRSLLKERRIHEAGETHTGGVLYTANPPKSPKPPKPPKRITRAGHAEIAARRALVLAELAEGPRIATQIAVALGLNTHAGESTVRKVLVRMVETGQIERYEANPNVHPPRYTYRLPEAPAAAEGDRDDVTRSTTQ